MVAIITGVWKQAGIANKHYVKPATHLAKFLDQSLLNPTSIKACEEAMVYWKKRRKL